MYRKVAVELPPEAKTQEELNADVVGILDMSLYGTRDAAVNFQREVSKLMRNLGFEQSKFNSSLYQHKKDDVKVLVHGDDFVASGGRSKILRFQKQLATRFTIKSKVVGSGSHLASRSRAASSGLADLAAGDLPGKELKEARILNRVVRWTPEGWEYEADQRHAELIVQAMGLEKARPVSSPGEEEPT